jgi:hypothetical protein
MRSRLNFRGTPFDPCRSLPQLPTLSILEHLRTAQPEPFRSTHCFEPIPIEPPRRLTNWAGFNVDDLSATSDGKGLVFQKWSAQVNIQIGELQDRNTKMTPPQRLTLSEAHNVPTAWTSDSNAIIFRSDRNGRYWIYKQELNRDSAEILAHLRSRNCACPPDSCRSAQFGVGFRRDASIWNFKFSQSANERRSLQTPSMQKMENGFHAKD